MTWNTDWTTGVSETISQIESQATSIADLQHEITQVGTSPRIDSSSNFVNANISGAPSTLQFALSNDSGSVAVSYFAAMQMF